MNKFDYKSPSSFEIFTKCDLRNRFKKFMNIKKSKNSKIKKPIFIVGCPRSGTTVLGKCLAAHPEIAGSDESLFLLMMWTIFNDMHQGNNKRKYTPLKNFLSAEKLIDNIHLFSDNVFAGLLERQKKGRYIDHTPWYVLLAPFIDIFYPDASFIHIIRDGRKVVRSLSVSYAKGFNWAGKDIKERTQLWVNLVDHGLNIKNFLPDRYLEIKYEDFYKYPVQTFENIFDFINLKFDKKVLKPLAIAHADPITKNIVINPRYFVLNNKKAKMHRYLDVNWPKEWTKENKKDFLETGGSLMKKLYPDLVLE